MPNFFLDNDDILFQFDYLDLAELARIQERGFLDAGQGGAAGARAAGDNGSDYAPLDAADAVDNYRRVLEIAGDIAGNTIAPRAEQIDAEGNTLNDDGTVTLHPLVADNLRRLAQADLMGFTLPRKYGGLNCPNLIYTMAIEMVSRADASLMNIFGLQGIAETIHAFADEATKDEYLPRFARGEVTGAMVLTEPDAGSDLQAVRLRAFEENGQWYLRGVKRFITNGCGEILLTLARSEPEIADGRGLSLFLSERSPRIKVRHLEHKLGIHGSPTCELVYDDAPARLIGQRQRGLITYVMALMNGARVGIAAQSLGIAEAAFRLAREYAHSRKQFGKAIERLPAVAEMVTDMKVQIEAARALVYETSRICDLENNNTWILEGAGTASAAPGSAGVSSAGVGHGGPTVQGGPPADPPAPSPAGMKARKELSRVLKRLNGMLTPMSKYHASEMCNRVANTALQVLGGSGYMTDYPAERFLRDARITNIYEGTSQLQIVAAVRGVCSGAFEKRIAEFEELRYEDAALAELRGRLVEAKEQVLAAITSVKGQSTDYMDLMGQRLVDAAAAVYMGHLLLQQAAGLRTRSMWPGEAATPGGERAGATDSAGAAASLLGRDPLAGARRRKVLLTRRFLDLELPRVQMHCEIIVRGERSALEQFDLLAGPVPAKD